MVADSSHRKGLTVKGHRGGNGYITSVITLKILHVGNVTISLVGHTDFVTVVQNLVIDAIDIKVIDILGGGNGWQQERQHQYC